MRPENVYRIDPHRLGSMRRHCAHKNLIGAAVTWRGALMLAALAALSIGAGSHSAIAQVQVQNGNALDANNQVGSGGSNNPIPGYVPLNPNAVGYANSATGAYNSVPRVNYQVVPVPLPGGGTSYARIPQLGQSSFNTSVPPSAMGLYNVNAISSGVPSTVMNSALGANGQGYLVQSQSNFATNPYSPTAVNGQAYLPPPYSPSNTMQNPAGFLPGTGLSANTNPGENGIPANATGGVVGQINPLFGLRQVRVQQAVTGQLPNPFGITPERKSAKENDQYNSSRNGSSTNTQNALNIGTSRITNSQAINGNAKIIKPTPPNGKAVNGSIGGQTAPGHIGGGGLYQQLLAELAGGKPSKITAPGLPGQSAITQTNLSPNPHKQTLVIDPITGLPIAPLTAQRLVGISNSNGRGSSSNSSTNGNMSNSTDMQLHAGWNISALNSLAGGTPGNFGQLMRQAEADQKIGRYVSAIENYQSAVQLQPGNPLPLIGQANAELSAGLYQSAAYNLKFVFTRHPELTALRYNLYALLPKSSLNAAHQQLHTMFGQKNNVAAFLLAYLDFQTGRTVELQSTLNQWAAWKNSGSWPVILKKAWIKADEHQAAGAAGSGKP